MKTTTIKSTQFTITKADSLFLAKDATTGILATDKYRKEAVKKLKRLIKIYKDYCNEIMKVSVDKKDWIAAKKATYTKEECQKVTKKHLDKIIKN